MRSNFAYYIQTIFLGYHIYLFVLNGHEHSAIIEKNYFSKNRSKVSKLFQDLYLSNFGKKNYFSKIFLN